MDRGVGLVAALVILGGHGCKRSAPSNAGPSDTTPPAATATVDAGIAGASAIFSAPIAGARVGHGDVIAAGLVVATRSITASRIDAAGRAAWTHPVVPEVAWSADAELHAWPIAAGAAIVWRGPAGKKSGHLAVVVAPDGRVVDGPIDVGSFVCATDDGLAWSEAAAGGGDSCAAPYLSRDGCRPRSAPRRRPFEASGFAARTRRYRPGPQR
jgi:hypothetical protein